MRKLVGLLFSFSLLCSAQGYIPEGGGGGGTGPAGPAGPTGSIGNLITKTGTYAITCADIQGNQNFDAGSNPTTFTYPTGCTAGSGWFTITPGTGFPAASDLATNSVTVNGQSTFGTLAAGSGTTGYTRAICTPLTTTNFRCNTYQTISSGTGAAGAQVTTAFNAGSPAYACSATTATYVEFLISTTMTANVVGTVGTCQASTILSFTVTQDGTGSRTWAITNFDPCPIIATAGATSHCHYSYDGTNGHLIGSDRIRQMSWTGRDTTITNPTAQWSWGFGFNSTESGNTGLLDTVGVLRNFKILTSGTQTNNTMTCIIRTSSLTAGVPPAGMSATGLSITIPNLATSNLFVDTVNSFTITTPVQAEVQCTQNVGSTSAALQAVGWEIWNH